MTERDEVIERLLDVRLGVHFTCRQLIECGETYALLQVEAAERGERNPVLRPQALVTYGGLLGLAVFILDPLWERFGPLQPTYGFAPPSLTSEVRKAIRQKRTNCHIDPSCDQHAGSELNDHGRPICRHGGAAVDFRVKGESMQTVAEWLIAEELPFDHFIFYGADRPLHVSWRLQPRRKGWQVIEDANGRPMPPRPFRPSGKRES